MTREVIVRELIHKAQNVTGLKPVTARCMSEIYLDEARRKTYHIKEPLRGELRAEISAAFAALPPTCEHWTRSFKCAELAVDGRYCHHHADG